MTRHGRHCGVVLLIDLNVECRSSNKWHDEKSIKGNKSVLIESMLLFYFALFLNHAFDYKCTKHQ